MVMHKRQNCDWHYIHKTAVILTCDKQQGEYKVFNIFRFQLVGEQNVGDSAGQAVRGEKGLEEGSSLRVKGQFHKK